MIASERERLARELDNKLVEFARTIPASKINVVVRKLALEGLRKIVRRTPVDTGRTRGNWQVTIGTPATGQRPTRYSDKGGQATIDLGAAVLEGLRLYSFPTVWITNNVPWILMLEEGGYSQGRSTRLGIARAYGGKSAARQPKTIGGYSRQAPNGMVAVTVEELLQEFKTEAAQT